MKEATLSVLSGPGSAPDALAEVLRTGAQETLATAIEAEVTTRSGSVSSQGDGRRRGCAAYSFSSACALPTGDFVVFH